ncbi:hypothetical protein LI148_15125 [Colidextribacter sp. 210702-DFI.3.9]|nr:hypothetical protein [Colidextribacter sp. 210702-DFI.3.9]
MAEVLTLKKLIGGVLAVAVFVCAAMYAFASINFGREFPIDGKNVSDIDTQRVVKKIADVKHLEDGSELCVNSDNFDLTLSADFDWEDDGAIRFFYTKKQATYSAQLRMFHEDNKYYITDSSEWMDEKEVFKLFHYLDALKYMPQEEIQKLSPNSDRYSVCMRSDGAPDQYERVIQYHKNGIEKADGWSIHLELLPFRRSPEGGYDGTGEEAIHLFYSE